MNIRCLFGFHKFGKAKEHNEYIHPFRIITTKIRKCMVCGKKDIFDAELLTYKSK